MVHADLQNRDYCAWREFLRGADGWNREQIREYQLGEVRRITKHAYESTSGYRALYDRAGVGGDSIGTLEDFRKLPLVEKQTIRDDLENFSTPMKERTYVTTGGSTGIPFGFYREPQAFSKELASKAHQYSRIGWQEGDRQFVLRGLPIGTPDHMTFVPEFNELRCSSYHLVPEWMERFLQRALDYRPDWLRCYPSSGYILACFLKETGRDFPPLKGILCASENLYDFQKQLLSEVFRTRVFSHYGHYELAVLAGFCERTDTYHVLPQYGFAELLDQTGRPVTQTGQMGEVVATSFLMHATPFIRYRTRDFAVLEGKECPSCGRPYQVWSRIEGRLQEFLVTGTGRHISMTAINSHDDIFNHIQQFQFHQRQKGFVTFRFIPKETCTAGVVEDMKRRLMIKLGEDVVLEMEKVPDIAVTGRGKHRFLVQELSLTYGDA
jgi:phenylacetate-CoA ligase